jgi:hypothetical protein
MEFYRYEWHEYAKMGIDEEIMLPRFPNPTVELHTYILLKETKRGYWICMKNWNLWKKWIPKKSKKRFAYPTIEEAKNNFILRTKKRIRILQRTVDCCKIALNLIDKLN